MEAAERAVKDDAAGGHAQEGPHRPGRRRPRHRRGRRLLRRRPHQPSQYDNAFSAKVQAGSTFKPYTLAAALENGFGLYTRVNGNSPMRVASRPRPPHPQRRRPLLRLDQPGHRHPELGQHRLRRPRPEGRPGQGGRRSPRRRASRPTQLAPHRPRRHVPARRGLGERRAERLRLRHLRQRAASTMEAARRSARSPTRQRQVTRSHPAGRHAGLQRAGRHRRHLRDAARSSRTAPARPPASTTGRWRARPAPPTSRQGRLVRRVHPAARRPR